jgi:hypothetical protein
MDNKKLHSDKSFISYLVLVLLLEAWLVLYSENKSFLQLKEVYREKRVYFESKQCLVRFIQTESLARIAIQSESEKISKIMLQTTALKVDIDSLKAAVSTHMLNYWTVYKFYYQKNTEHSAIKAIKNKTEDEIAVMPSPI